VQLRADVDRAAELGGLAREEKRLRGEVDAARGATTIIGQSPRIRALLELADRVAASDASVLILGESGTGKELLARTIHRKSGRKDGPFVAFDCSALNSSVLESELFGHEKGAFTGAQRSRRGLFREAQAGTLFLDEIGDVAPEVQNKLLRVLQEREVKPVGGDSFVKVDVRVLAATNKDLKALIAQGAFREDLYYRLAVVPLEVPPLRARREDIPALVAHFLGRRGRGPAADAVRRPTRISPEAMAILVQHEWKGNVRELENVIELASILSKGDEIRDSDLPPLGGEAPKRARSSVAVARLDPDGPRKLKELIADTVKAVERQAIEDALRSAGGSPTQAARMLGLSRAAFYNKLKAYHIRT
jgi:two-component system response regulator HydG